ncbi:GAF domain-containing protein [Streptomyces aureus]
MTDPVPGLTPLLEAVLSVGTELELRATLQRIVDAAAELTGARYATLAMRDPARDGLVRIRTAGPPVTGASPAGRGTATANGPETGTPPEQGTTTANGPEAGTPPGPEADICLDVPIRVDDEVFGNLCLADKACGPVTLEDEQLVRLLAEQAGIAIGNARLYETARQRERWIEGASAVTTTLLSGGTGADALTTVAERARILAGAAAGIILEPTDEGGMRVVVASAPGDPAGIVGTTVSPGSPLLGQLLGGEPVFVEDAATDPRITVPARSRFGPSMMLPLQTEGRLIGTLVLPRGRGDRPYTEVERLLAGQFASQAALALVLADARHSRELLAVYEDRDRIARDLHDLVVQRLFATGMMLESTQRRNAAHANGGSGNGRSGDAGTGAAGNEDGGTGDAGAEEVSAALGRAVDELEATVQEVRTAIFALQQPPADAPTTFRGRVLRETAGAAAVLGVRPSTRFAGPVDNTITDQVAGRLIAVLRRALAAASRRSGVSRIEVVVDATVALPDGRPGVRLTVHDDGPPDGTDVTWESAL